MIASKLGIYGTMTNQGNWEKQKKACRLCGQFIRNTEEYVLVVVPSQWSQQERNFIVHTHEWDELQEGKETIEELFEELVTIKQPKAKNRTVVKSDEVEAFKRVIARRGYRIKQETANRIVFKLSRDTARFTFDKRFGKIEYTGIVKLLDGIWLNELLSRLHEEWQKELGKEVSEGFRAEKVFAKAVENMNEILGK